IPHTGQILHAAATHEHNGVLLQVMTYPRYVRSNFDTVGQASASDFAQSGVGLLGRLCVDADANPSLFRTSLQRRRLRFGPDLIAPGTYQLCKRRHGSPSIELEFAALSTSRPSAKRLVSRVHTQKGPSSDPGYATRN